MKRIFVGNIPFSSSEGDVSSWFESHGLSVESTEIIVDRTTGRPRGFGFVQLKNASNGEDAIRMLHGKSFGGRALTVQPAVPIKSYGERDAVQRKSETDESTRAA
jgi:RNA recognition motif-containing protein